MKGGQIEPPPPTQKKLPLKSPGLLGLIKWETLFWFCFWYYRLLYFPLVLSNCYFFYCPLKFFASRINNSPRFELAKSCQTNCDDALFKKSPLGISARPKMNIVVPQISALIRGKRRLIQIDRKGNDKKTCLTE